MADLQVYKGMFYLMKNFFIVIFSTGLTLKGSIFQRLDKLQSKPNTNIDIDFI